MPTVNDNLITWLNARGFNKGTITDRQMAFLKSQPGLPTNKDRLSFSDLQKTLGKRVRPLLSTSDWA